MPVVPSDAELSILTFLWKAGASTVREVHEALAKGTTYTSTLKQMQLMCEKGMLRRSERFRSHVYEHAISREQVQTRYADDLMHRVFAGSVRSLVLGALTARRASPDELAEMDRLLNKLEKRSKSE